MLCWGVIVLRWSLLYNFGINRCKARNSEQMAYHHLRQNLAKSIKEKSDWCCDKCGRVCLRPGNKTNSDKPCAYNLQVHHWDRNPSNNRVENLISLCSGCHLSYHRVGRGNISPGQLSLFDGFNF
jgi:hypothetical protein